MVTIADAVRLAQVVKEIQLVENELRQRRKTLTARFWRHLLPANPAVVGDRIRATDRRTRDLESRLIMLRNEQQELIVRAARPDPPNPPRNEH
jgi:hypothetical protein